MPARRSKSLIFDIYGAFVRPRGGWIAIADLITLMGALGVDEQAVRSSVSRLSRRRMLVRKRQRDQIGYELSPEAQEIIEEGDLRIFTGRQPAERADGWVVAVFSVPEGERDKRHQLRSQLTWLGFGNLGGGVWLAPSRVLPRAVDVVRRLELERYVDLFEAHYREFDDVADMVARCWDLPGLDALYQQFVQAVQPVLERWEQRGGDGSDREAFLDYTIALHQWRKMPYLDPGLPPELLSPDWHGRTASELFARVVERLEQRARRYVETVVAAGAGSATTAVASSSTLPRGSKSSLTPNSTIGG